MLHVRTVKGRKFEVTVSVADDDSLCQSERGDGSHKLPRANGDFWKNVRVIVSVFSVSLDMMLEMQELPQYNSTYVGDACGKRCTVRHSRDIRVLGLGMPVFLVSRTVSRQWPSAPLASF
jgi:hypothetical protein